MSGLTHRWECTKDAWKAHWGTTAQTTFRARPGHIWTHPFSSGYINTTLVTQRDRLQHIHRLPVKKKKKKVVEKEVLKLWEKLWKFHLFCLLVNSILGVIDSFVSYLVKIVILLKHYVPAWPLPPVWSVSGTTCQHLGLNLTISENDIGLGHCFVTSAEGPQTPLKKSCNPINGLEKLVLGKKNAFVVYIWKVVSNREGKEPAHLHIK